MYYRSNSYLFVRNNSFPMLNCRQGRLSYPVICEHWVDFAIPRLFGDHFFQCVSYAEVVQLWTSWTYKFSAPIV